MFKNNIFAYAFYLLCCCCIYRFSVAVGAAYCDEFFPGNPWPLKNAASVVKLCQIEQTNISVNTCQRSIAFYPTLIDISVGTFQPTVYYATLFDTYRRTPLYSANKVILRSK